jgi:squalene-hopene/tetraprenyl-beta-curcumene cyclase
MVMTEVLNNRIRTALTNTRKALDREYDVDSGCWPGRLSSSALSTAIVVFALSRVDAAKHADQIRNGLAWLAAHQNRDGGWGDTVDSPSNVTATVLCWAALSQAESGDRATHRSIRTAESWLGRVCGGLGAEEIVDAIVAHYGHDRTFSTPILMMCALAGRLGDEADAWPRIIQLPFELSAMPHRCFRWLKLMVVSYALPALIAIGLARHRKCPSPWMPLRVLRDRLTPAALSLAARMQPDNGGYEEATPLTGFVVMALVAAGEADHEIVARGVGFLLQSVRDDGSWPIDTSLATWVSVLAVTARTDVHGSAGLTPGVRRAVREWLLGQQHGMAHPLTFEGRGGWAWSDLPGAMPDADDTSGVLVALRRLGDVDERAMRAAEAGIGWLMSIQNTDGGMPTFCRGWGKLPFDRSCPDITAHTVRAFLEWRHDVSPALRRQMDRSIRQGTRYLHASMRADGSWVPLWFGNQHDAALENPTYGTAQVLIALRQIRDLGVAWPELDGLLASGEAWLVSAQNADGGWGGRAGLPSTIEETSLAICALDGLSTNDVVSRGVNCLLDQTLDGTRFPSAPIGLYFAKLWYSERLYPLVFACWALERVGPRGEGGSL